MVSLFESILASVRPADRFHELLHSTQVLAARILRLDAARGIDRERRHAGNGRADIAGVESARHDQPAAGIATATIFASPDLVRNTGPVILTGSFASAGLGDGFGRNDLQPVAEAHCPEVRAVAEWLQGSFGNSRMTGSGSAVFARVGMEDQSLAAWPAQSLPGPWIVRLCRSLDHHRLLGWAD